MNDEPKARTYERIIFDAKFAHEFWLDWWNKLDRKDTNSAGFAEGIIHYTRQVLKQSDYFVPCICGPCENEKRQLAELSGEKP